MKRKNYIYKYASGILCASMMIGNILPVTAATTETQSTSAETDSKETDVLYAKSASYFVTIPKTIVLGTDKASNYSVKVEGDITSDKQVYVSPVDGISETDGFDFYMRDTNTVAPKADVAATVTQNKFYWNFRDVAASYEETNNKIEADGLTSGTWKGTFDFEINLHKVKEADPYETAPVNELDNWNYTLDEESKTVTLNYYTGSAEDVIVYANYPVDTNTYHTKLASFGENGTSISTNYMFYDNNKVMNVKTIKFSEEIDTSNVTNMSNMFTNCRLLTSIDLSGFDTSNVTDMSNMFWGCTALTDIDLGNFDTSNVTNMQNMFNNCRSLTNLDLSNFDTGNVTDMSNMFSYCQSLKNLDVSNFDTSKVTDMTCMFWNCESLESLDVSNFDTNKVKKMNYLFSGCSKLTNLDLSNFNTSNVMHMKYMFSGCELLTSLDLSNFDTKMVFYMNYMFSDCLSLNTIYVSKDMWSVRNAETTDMFKNCGTSVVTFK